MQRLIATRSVRSGGAQEAGRWIRREDSFRHKLRGKEGWSLKFGRGERCNRFQDKREG